MPACWWGDSPDRRSVSAWPVFRYQAIFCSYHPIVRGLQPHHPELQQPPPHQGLVITRAHARRRGGSSCPPWYARTPRGAARRGRPPMSWRLTPRAYANRWAIEETHRNCKQFLGAEDPQCWRRRGPERAGALSLFIYSLVWYWYVVVHGDSPAWRRHPWYGRKASPSFVDALAEARRELWRERVFVQSDRAPLSTKFQTALIETLV